MEIEKIEVNVKSESWETFAERNGLPKKIVVESFNDEESFKGLNKILPRYKRLEFEIKEKDDNI